MDNAQLLPIPEALQEIPKPPKKLYLVGSLPDPKTHVYLCVVGSRKYSSYGQSVCQKLIAGLRGYPVVVVSGLALGMDTLAHEAALEAGLTTIALPGSGLSSKALYPASNFNLAKKILKNGGALLSEFEPDTKAAYWTFPARNRLMAGISVATLIIEAEKKSGTLITADLAMQYNRDVYAVPGSIFSSTSVGTNNLLKSGATPITNSSQLLRELGFTIAEKTPDDALKNCSDEERAILELLKSPLPRGELIRSLKSSTHETNVLLSAMEIKGLIRESGGEMHRI